ncbi:MAG TPA: glycosyltransferase family 2 protein [Phenylobacterium sp.]|nr:glycosyltransferase family 2 protein [Phenylobacterium sp.]
MHVAVAIVGFNNAQDIVHCLGELGRSTHADFEVVICENGGPAAFAALEAALPKALPGGQAVRAVLAPGNLGYAGGVNRCIEESPGADAWWVLNPDTHPYPEALAALVERLERGDCDAVGCTLHLPNGRVQSHGGRWTPWLGRAVSIGHSSPLSEHPDPAWIESRQNYLNGAAMLMGRRFVETVGLMREEYFLYCEEVEWCLRGIARGMRLGFAPKAVVLHYQGTTTGNPPDIRQRSKTPVYLMERNKLLLTRDLFPGLMPVVVVAAFAVIFARFARRGAWRQVGYALSGWRAGLRDERGPPAWIAP